MRSWVRLLPPVWVVLLAAVSPPAQGAQSGATRPDCTRCQCTSQGGIYHLQCTFNGTQALLLDGAAALDFGLPTFYMRLQDLAELQVTADFLRQLRRFQSVAVDLWRIGNVSLPTDYRPGPRFQFIGVGIANSSLPTLSEGIFSHSRTVGLRLSGVTIGTIGRGAFADIERVRYVELRQCQVGVIEGPQIGVIPLQPRHDIHHGSRGLLIQNCSIGVIQEAALAVAAEEEDEFVMISDSQIGEVGRAGLSVVGSGSFHVNGSRFSFLNTRALVVKVGGDISITQSRVSAAAPLPLSGVRGGNRTRLEQVTFGAAVSPSLVMLELPTGTEQLSELQFSCGAGPDPTWLRRIEQKQTVSAAEKWYLKRVAAAASCSQLSDGAVSAEVAASAQSHQSGASTASPATATTGPQHTKDSVFGSPARLGLELAILVAAAATVALLVVAVRRHRRRRAAAAADTQALVEAAAYQ